MLANKIQGRTAVIGVVGLGYVGLPLAIAFAEAGYQVIGIDNQQSKLDMLQRGESYIEDVYAHRIKVVLASDIGRFKPVNWGQAGKADVFIVCVPTPMSENGKPDLSYIIGAVNQVKGKLASTDSMVVLESSTYPGTTRDVVLPMLDRSARYVAYSPERVDPGSTSSKGFSILSIPKLVSGIDNESAEMATLLYKQIITRVVPVSSVEVAETAKLYENAFRNVNIALANEMALICEKIGVSVWEVIDAAATKPFGFMPFYPGVGVGGHCIPKDPCYLVDKAHEHHADTELIDAALRINNSMPAYVARWIARILTNKKGRLIGAKVLVLGITFKRDVSDTRESPSVELIEILDSWGADVSYHDFFVPILSRQTARTLLDIESVELTDKCMESADCVVIATDHSQYDWEQIVDRAKLVFDTRNATRGIVSERIYRLGERKTA